MTFFGLNELYHDTKEGLGHLLSKSCMSDLSSTLNEKALMKSLPISGRLQDLENLEIRQGDLENLESGLFSE